MLTLTRPSVPTRQPDHPLAVRVEDDAALVPTPPNDDEVWSYVQDDGKRFLQFSSLSRICLGSALVFLSLRGTWLLLLLPFAAAVVVGGLISLVWSTQVPPFDTIGHRRRRDQGPLTTPSIDVFICTCGEDPLIVENTICHAMNLEYEGTLNVFVLDDRASTEVHQASLRWGATYIVRPRRGWMKKAGNLHHAYGESSGDLILVLDADFAVRRDFLQHTVPYFDDPHLGILQTPQFFRVSSDNWVERGAASQQEQFYRVGMRARDKHGGAICVGTNAVYRRAALDERGGMALLEHSEDIFTGMKVIDAGYRVDYLPLPLAAGSAPDNTAALASQQYRWARGNFALAGTPLFKRMRLTPMQRLGLWDGWIFYVTSALSPVVAIFVPIVSLVEAPYLITLAPAAMILPALFTEFYLQPRWLHLPDGRASRRVGLISQVAHLYALRDHLTDRDQEWIPTGGKRPSGAKKGTDRIPDQISAAAFVGFLVIMALLAYRVSTGWPLLDLAPVGVLGAIALPAALGTTKRPRYETAVEIVQQVEHRGRDAFLDVVRTISIIRVMFWHAFGFWWISWAFAAMPAVFYVSGAVLAKSLLTSSCLRVTMSRLKRLLVPYYAFLGLALGLVYLADPEVADRSPLEVLSWLVPYRAPAALSWEQGWISTPLWFLRALIIVMLLTPLLRPIGRRIPGAIQAVVWLGSLVVLDRWIASQTTVLATEVARGLGDVVCFGGFFVLGVSGHHLRHRLTRLARVRLTAGLTVASLGWAAAFPPAGWVVNNSYALFGLVGLAWLCGLLALEDHLRHLGEIPSIARFVGWVTDGAMSLYLWHSLALVFTYQLIGRPSSLGHYLVFGGLFSLILSQVVAAARPLESIGNKRSKRSAPVRPVRIALLALALLLLASRPTLFPQLTDSAAPPTPSGRPIVPQTTQEVEPTTDERRRMARSGEAWMVGHGVEAMAVVEIGTSTGAEPDQVFYGDPSALDRDAPFEALSVTKSMVAAVALQLVDEETLTLDEPLPDIRGIPRTATSQLSLRRLLSHSTGLRDYREAVGYRRDLMLTPIDAVLLGIDSSDLSSTDSKYAATNYLLVGLLIEEVTNQPLSSVLQQRLFEPLGLDQTELVNNQRAGFVGHASGGVVSTLDELARWYDALLRQRVVLSPEMLDEMFYGGMIYHEAAGLGTWRRCPCGPPTRAEPTPFLYAFHDGGDVRLVYIPSRDVVLAIRFSKSLYDADHIVGDIDDVIFAVADRRELLER